MNRNQFGLSGASLNVCAGGFVVSLPAAGGCVELVHGSYEHIGNGFSFLQQAHGSC